MYDCNSEIKSHIFLTDKYNLKILPILHLTFQKSVNCGFFAKTGPFFKKPSDYAIIKFKNPNKSCTMN